MHIGFSMVYLGFLPVSEKVPVCLSVTRTKQRKKESKARNVDILWNASILVPYRLIDHFKRSYTALHSF